SRIERGIHHDTQVGVDFAFISAAVFIHLRMEPLHRGQKDHSDAQQQGVSLLPSHALSSRIPGGPRRVQSVQASHSEMNRAAGGMARKGGSLLSSKVTPGVWSSTEQRQAAPPENRDQLNFVMRHSAFPQTPRRARIKTSRAPAALGLRGTIGARAI